MGIDRKEARNPGICLASVEMHPRNLKVSTSDPEKRLSPHGLYKIDYISHSLLIVAPIPLFRHSLLVIIQVIYSMGGFV